MKRVVVERFGPPEVMKVVEEPDPLPAAGQVRVRLTSIGINHADLMARAGKYKISSGDPPFTPGLEGGVIDMLGPGVATHTLGQRVILSPDAPRSTAQGGQDVGGTYRTHFVCPAAQAISAPDQVDDAQLGTLWLSYLTAWGCLAWRQKLKAGQTVGISAASSSAAMAAAQVVRKLGGVPVGLTSSPEKVEKIKALPTCAYRQVFLTAGAQDRPAWVEQAKAMTAGKGIDIFYDPVASGAFLSAEIHAAAQGGTIWIYGLMGAPGPVDLHPIIRKSAAIRGWVLSELIRAGGDDLAAGCDFILAGWRDGAFRQHVARTFKLDDVRTAHEFMEQGSHIGKLILLP